MAQGLIEPGVIPTEDKLHSALATIIMVRDPRTGGQLWATGIQ